MKMMILSRNMRRGQGVLGPKCFVRSRSRRGRGIGATGSTRKYMRMRSFGFRTDILLGLSMKQRTLFHSLPNL